MEYAEGIKINGLHSFVDFDLTIAARQIDLPEKTSIRKTVPFMNGFYDYSKINGAVCWAERIIQYTFDIVGETVELMDAKRTAVVNWLCNLHDVDIYDDTIPDYHFHGSYDSISQNEDGEKSELTVTFICYPFMISNEPIKYTCNKSENYIIRNDGQPTKLYVNGNANITMNGSSIALNSEKMTDVGFVLSNGQNEVQISIENELTLPYQYNTDILSSGISFELQNDGKVVANGTATDNAFFAFRNVNFRPPNGTYFISCLLQNGDASTFRANVSIIKNGIYSYHYDYGEGVVITVDDEVEGITIGARIAPNYTAENIVFEPKMYRYVELQYLEEVL